MSREAMKAAVEALTAICTNFPTDSDLIEAGWATHEVNAACDAYDKGRAALSLLRAALEGEEKPVAWRWRYGSKAHNSWMLTENPPQKDGRTTVLDVEPLYASPVAATRAADRLHQQIMNLPAGVPPVPDADDLPGSAEVLWAQGYKFGHRDARHAAAELVSAALSESEQAPVAAPPTPQSATEQGREGDERG